MAATNDDLLISISTDLTTVKRQLKQLGQEVGNTTGGIKKQFDSLGKSVDQSMSPVQKRINQLVGIPVPTKIKEWQGALAHQADGLTKVGERAKLTSNQMLNLSRQGNDVATMFALGANPMQIFASQAGQIYDALEQGPNGLSGSLKAVGASIVGVVTKFPLITAALAVAGAAFLVYEDNVKHVDTLDEVLKKHADNIKLLGDAYDQVSGKQQKYATISTDTINVLNAAQAKQLQEKLKDATDEIFKGASLSSGVGRGGGMKDFVRSEFKPFEDAINDLKASAKDTAALRTFTDAVTAIGKANPDLAGPAAELIEFSKTAQGIAQQLPDFTKEVSAVTGAFHDLQDKIDHVDNERVKKKLTEIRERFQNGEITIEDVNKALQALEDKNLNLSGIISPFEKLFDVVSKVKDSLGSLKLPDNLGQLSPLYSGGGKFLNEDQKNTFDAMESRLNDAAGSAAAKMLKTFEGFVPKAKWDVNHYRAGFGSDTTTDSAGNISEVTKDTIVTLEDAQRDLSRRIIEFQDGIQNAIGIDTWKSLSDSQQAALTSIAYNYGKLPKSIVAAIQSGGGPEVVATAIANLTANPKRRKEEAQAYLSGTGISMNEAGLGNKKSPDELFKGDQAAVQRRIDQINAEYEAQAKLNPLIKDYGFQVAEAKKYQELLNDAQKRGVEITPEMDAGLHKLAEGYAAATAGRNQLTEAQHLAAQAAQQGSEFGKDLLGGFISDLKAGKTAAEALSNALSKVADKLLDAALNGLFGTGPGGNGTGGPLSFIGSLLGAFFDGGGYTGDGAKNEPAGIVHKGEVVFSQDDVKRFGGARNVDRMRRGYADGGIVGVPSIRAPNVPRVRSGASGNNTHITVGVSADNNGNLMPFVQSVTQDNIRRAAPQIVHASVQQGQKATQQNMPGYLASAQARKL